MDKDIFEGIEAGLKEAVQVAKGDCVEGLTLHQIKVPEIDTKAVRAATGLSRTNSALVAESHSSGLRNKYGAGEGNPP